MRSEDEAEYREYVTNRLTAMRYFAYLSCGDWQQAEDTVQIAFEKLYVKWSRARGAANLDAYTRRVVVNSLINERRRGWFRRERPHAEPREPAAADPDRAEDRMSLLAALSRLPLRERTAVVLRFWEDQSVEATAHAMGCSVSTVKKQTARGLRTLRELLSDLVVEDLEGVNP